MHTLRDLELKGKRVLVRVDFNVPMDDSGAITDDIRIRTALPTIRYLLEQEARVILCSHMGSPKGKRVDSLSLAPAARHLAGLLGRSIAMAPDCVGPEVEALAATLQPGQVLMLENLRFHAGEQANDQAFARGLTVLADVYVNDAFAAAHRAHASVVGVPALCPLKAAGFLLQKELEYFHRAMDEPQRPLVAIVGGAKVSSKLGALENMLNRVDRLLIGGAMANTFLKSQGLSVGASKVEEDLLETAARLLNQARRQAVKVYLPVDVVAADTFSATAVTKLVTTQDIPENWMALDIGPATVQYFREAMADARTIVWNGPVGAFEMAPFARGTMALAQALAASHALTITGGGDSNAAVKLSGESESISYMSTGGGAFLMLMEGKALPGVSALE
ncbi:MAG: phosphoglycerate kinase [Desulfobulbaceae bacterium A2]|nr:MAG: phosphoglycerate kinase [Desulfobulbaceae bacterium A2]